MASDKSKAVPGSIPPVSVPDAPLTNDDLIHLIKAVLRGQTIDIQDVTAALDELRARRIQDAISYYDKEKRKLRKLRKDAMGAARYWRNSSTHPNYYPESVADARYWNHCLVQLMRSHRTRMEMWQQ